MFKAMAHQRRVIPWMTRGDIMLVWDPGVGKTYPALVASQFLDSPTLCVVPAHLREQWAAAAREHVPMSPVLVLDKIKEPADLDGIWQIVICSYEYASTIQRWKELRRWKWGAIVLDEAHYLMNLDANRTRAILGVKPLTGTNGLVFAAEFIWLLTGTPFQFPNQIYSILAAIYPKALKRPNGTPGFMTLREWEIEFCEFKPDPSGFGEKVCGAKNIPELRRRLDPFLDKMRLEDAAPELRGLTVDTIPIRDTLTNITRGLSQDVISLYHSLTEILTDPSTPDEEKLAVLEASGLVMAQLRHTIALAKVKPTVKIIQNELASGVKKVLVFGWHREPLRALADDLGAPLINGDTSPKAKREALDEFLNDERCEVLVGQISALGTGTDGLQAVCHRTIFMEASWAFRENKQCLHRTYRKGQRLPCHASFVTLLGSVDEYVARVLKRNAEIVRQVLD